MTKNTSDMQNAKTDRQNSGATGTIDAQCSRAAGIAGVSRSKIALRSLLALCICITATLTTAMFTTVDRQERRVFRTASLTPLTPEQEHRFFPEAKQESFIRVFGNVYSHEASLEPVKDIEPIALHKPAEKKRILSFTSDGAVFKTVDGDIALIDTEDKELPSISKEEFFDWCMRNDTLDPVAVGRLIASVSLSPAYVGKGNAAKYRDLVELYAEKYSLSTSLIFAIMHTESNFNPFAASPSNALGLMQVVPETAGNEVYRYLKGQQGIPTVEGLLQPEKNIQYGTTYLHLLSRRYFDGVISQESRDMCVIAAYNGGPGAVLRTFDKDREVAVAVINSMTPTEVYETLTTKTPSSETRRYVDVVLAHRRNYAGQ